ncbi:nitrite reductase small subunit NirD [Methylocucumis oryzae]|uniref:Nitrite reductase n=1 Tax=Methylocucumis oryzae TaxID=1632867 RepID=A0A0F3IGG5_9GAMM|nr:nitrite reductase small subunit NirD [Methylocucumis oryzae]KJV05846.1 nitrite reductase [Methylocucumis oryzae]
MTTWVEICSSDELQPDSGVCALVDGKQVALFYSTKDQMAYAISNFDPFGQANVLSRGILGDINGQLVVASPLYKQHFNLLTGECLEDASVVVPAYQTRIVDGRVAIAIA